MNKIGRILAYASRKCQLGKRSFLSDAYKCQEVWNGRLNSSVMKKINLDNMYQELDQAFQNNGNASVVDIDLFSNSIQDESFADELEDIIHKLRLSQYTSSMLPSTHHAVIRAYLAMGKYDALMRILNDRLNYGIFPDCYSSNLMMDTFLKAKKYREAAKVATFQMLQEDWGHPITSFLGLLSCHMYLKTEDSEPWEVEIHENDEPEEEIKVRVHFIQNKYFDDHFDLKEPNHLIGKTFVTLSKALPENDPVRTTYELMGWALYEKWEKAKSLLHKISSEEKDYVIPEGVQLMEKVLNGSNNEQTKDEAKDLLHLVSTLSSSKLQGQSSLLDLIKARVQEAISEQEKKDIENQIIKLKSWEDLREKAVQIQAETRQKESIMKLVREKKKELSEKEEELFFFENKDKLDLMAENNDLLRSKLISDTKKAKKADDDYIPPDVK